MTGPVFVTGASGFIGGALIAELAARNMSVTAISRRPCPMPDGVVAIKVDDYRNAPLATEAALIHLAEMSDIAKAENLGDGHVAEVRDRTAALLGKNYHRFVYVSSGRVYGCRSSKPHSPTDPVDPDCVYAAAKLAAEKLVRAADGVVVRIGNIYGPPLKSETVISDILNQIPGADPLIIRDDNPARDFLWIDDVARGLADIVLGTATGIFNLGTGIATSPSDVARIALAAAGEDSRPIVANTPKSSGEINAIALDSASTTAVFRWRPAVSLAEGIKALMQERLCPPAP